jgi:hypothetical protein
MLETGTLRGFSAIFHIIERVCECDDDVSIEHATVQLNLARGYI